MTLVGSVLIPLFQMPLVVDRHVSRVDWFSNIGLKVVWNCFHVLTRVIPSVL